MSEKVPGAEVDDSFIRLAEGTLGTGPKTKEEVRQLDTKFAAAPSTIKSAEDIANAAMLKAKLESAVEAKITPEKIVEQKFAEATVIPEKNDPVDDFLGKENAHGTLGELRGLVENTKSTNVRDINTSFLKTGGVSAALGTVTGLGAWALAGSGIGTVASIAGVPLMTAVALGAAPVGLGIAAIAGGVWAVKRLRNRFKAKKAEEALQ